MCAGSLFLAVFFLLPWLQCNGQQAFLLDIAQRQLWLAGQLFTPSHAPTLACLVLAAFAGLAIITNLLGRVWCAYACPQTVLGRVYTTLARASGALTSNPRAAALLHHSAWAAVAIWTGITFVGYFSPIRTLWAQLPSLGWTSWEACWALFYAALTWANIAYLRQRVCVYLCPYARVHGYCQDQDTKRISYDARRGEPRGIGQSPTRLSVLARARGRLNSTTAADYAFRAAYPAIAGVLPHFNDDRLGDCLDCGNCVRACPQALDIRKPGTDQCIECGSCADACNTVMAQHGYAAGLIDVRSHNALQGRPMRHWRPRLWVPTALASALLIAAYLFAPA